MGMTLYAAHVYVVSEEKNAYFQIGFPNEMEPEMLIKDAFTSDFNDPAVRKELIANSFDANYIWEDEEPYTLENAVSDWWDECGIPWFDEEAVAELDEEDFAPNQYDDFCQTVEAMRNIKYVLLAVDADKPSQNYGEFWYDALAYDFVRQRQVNIDWRGDYETHKELYDEFPFEKETAQKIVEQLEKNQIDSIDVGDFVLNGAPYGKVTVKDIQGGGQQEKTIGDNTAFRIEEDIEETKQIERITSLITNVDEIDFKDKAFVFDRLDYVPINGEYHGPDSPEHPIVKQVIEAGGLMRRSVSGKTDYLVLNNHAVQSGIGKKCKDALTQVDKGNNIEIITVDNLLDVLDKRTKEQCGNQNNIIEDFEEGIPEQTKTMSFAAKGELGIVAGYEFAMGLKSNGTVIAIGSNDCGQIEVNDWKDIIAISTSGTHTVGLKTDGTVVATGENYWGQIEVDDWRDIIAIVAGSSHTVGLKSDGTVIAVGCGAFGEIEVQDWKDIIAIAAGDCHTVGLKSDGTVVSTKITAESCDKGQTEVAGWKDIVAVSACGYITVGLKSNGTVIATGGYEEELMVDNWEDIIAVSTCAGYVIGLKSSGTIIVEPDYYYDFQGADDWEDIIAVAAGENAFFGLKSDGTVLVEGTFGELDPVFEEVQDWKDIVIQKHKYMGEKCKDAFEQIDKRENLTTITAHNLMEALPSLKTASKTKTTNTQTLTFNKARRVTIDGDLVIFIPDGFHYARDGFGGNKNWLYIVPEDYPLELDHIEARPLSFGVVPTTITILPESASVDNINGCKEFLLANNALQPGVAIKECICSEHCFFIYQTWLDSKDNKYNKINGVLFAGDRMYQFHTFMNHDKAISDDEKVIRQFELISRLWMKHVVLSDDSICKAKGDPEEVKATIADVTRIIKQSKEAALPTLSDEFGDDLKDSYSLIAAMFYLKNGIQIDTSRIQSLRNMLGQDLSKEYLMTLLKDHEAQSSTITDIIRAPMHDRVMSQTVLLDKFAGTDIEGGMTWVHFIGVEELLKVLCEENNIDYDLNEFCLECVESMRTLFSEKWESGDAYRLNESTFVIHRGESERRWNKTEKSKEKTSKDENDKEERSKQDSEREKKSLQRIISNRKREIDTLSAELEQLERVGDNKEEQAKYIEKILEERYRTFHELHPVDWSQEPEIERVVKDAESEFSRLKKEFKRKYDHEMNEIRSGVYSSLYDPELQYHVERLQKYAEKYVKDLTRVFNRVESNTKRFHEKGISPAGMKKLVKVMDAIYEEGDEIKISFNDSVDEVTMVYECMPPECGTEAIWWRAYQENMLDDIEEIDRQKEAKANKSVQEKLNYAQKAYERVKNKLEEAESEPDRNRRELAELEEELEELLDNYDAETIIIEDDFNTIVDKLQRNLDETVQRKDKKIQEKRELEAALERTVAFSFSKKNKYKEEISATDSLIRQLENDEEELEKRIHKETAQKESKIKSLDSKIGDLGTKIAEIRKQIETAPDRITSLKKELEARKIELVKAQQEADSFHIDYLIREHSDILQEMKDQIGNKKQRIAKLKGEVAQLERDILEIE